MCAQPTRRGLLLSPPSRLAVELVGGCGGHGSCWCRSALLTGYRQRGDSACLLLAQTIERSRGFDRGRIHDLHVARHEPGGHTLAKHLVKELLEHGGGVQLAAGYSWRVRLIVECHGKSSSTS